MRMQWRTIAVLGALACFLSGTVEQSFARQTRTSQPAPPPKKGEKGTQAVASSKKPTVAKKKEQKTKEIKSTVRTKQTGERSKRRLTKAQRRVRVARRPHSAPAKVVRKVEPVIIKDYESVLLADAESGQVLLAEDIDKQWPAASLTKMMVGLLAIEDIARERFSLQTPVIISERATRARGRTIGLRIGEILPLGELLQAMLVTSANDAAVAVAERIRGSIEACVASMNSRARKLDMTQTEFQTVNGMPLHDGNAGDFSSARDLMTLARVLLRYDLVLEWTSHDQMPFRDGLVMLPNTNRLVGKVDGVTGLKTGFTSRARYNLVATAQRGSLSLIAVVLGGRNSRIRFETAVQYLEWGFTNYRDQSASSGEKELYKLPVHPFEAVVTHTSLP
jgi:D-alanyl-D-alanine carboxypeptidase (penicillin-binding protein 5/6)